MGPWKKNHLEDIHGIVTFETYIPLFKRAKQKNRRKFVS